MHVHFAMYFTVALQNRFHFTCWAGTCPWYPGSSPPLCLRWRPARCPTSRPGSAAPRRTPCRRWNRCSPVRSDSSGSIGSCPPDALSLQKHTCKEISIKRICKKFHSTDGQKKMEMKIGFNFRLHNLLLHLFNIIQIALNLYFYFFITFVLIYLLHFSLQKPNFIARRTNTAGIYLRSQ